MISRGRSIQWDLVAKHGRVLVGCKSEFSLRIAQKFGIIIVILSPITETPTFHNPLATLV